VPLWRLLLDLSSRELANLLDLSYLEEDLTREQAVEMIEAERERRTGRERVLIEDIPVTTPPSVGFSMTTRNSRTLDRGFRTLKLKVGSQDWRREVRRATLLHQLAGAECRIMVDANQQWTVQQAARAWEAVREIDPYWIEEPTHPDDIEGHGRLADRIAPLRIALGEHVPNRIMSRNFMVSRAMRDVSACLAVLRER
jgi:L-fuconate dehydratase